MVLLLLLLLPLIMVLLADADAKQHHITHTCEAKQRKTDEAAKKYEEKKQYCRERYYRLKGVADGTDVVAKKQRTMPEDRKQFVKAPCTYTCAHTSHV